MASCITDQWATGAPQAKLEVTQSSQTGGRSTLSYTLSYIANSPAKSATADRDYTITINGNFSCNPLITSGVLLNSPTSRAPT